MPSDASSTTSSKSSRERLGVGGGLAQEFEKSPLLPLFGRRHLGDDLLRQDVERRHRRLDSIEAALAHCRQKRRALDQLVASGGEEDPFGDAVTGVVGAADPLQESGDGPGRAHLAGELDRADVDAQLQRGRSHQRPQIARSQPGLGAPPPLGRQAPVVGRDLVRAKDLAQKVSQALGQPAGVDEHERRLVALHVLGDPRPRSRPSVPGKGRPPSPALVARC